MGVRFKEGGSENGNGWIPCHAMGREDKTPSAAVNARTGVYVDRGGQGEAIDLFNFAVKYGHAADWRDARKMFATKAGLAKRLPKKDTDRPEDKFESCSWNPLACRAFPKAFPGVSVEALELASGGRMAKYPARSKTPQYVVVFPAFGPGLLDEPPRGFVLQECTGGMLEIFQGENNPPELRKRTNVGPSGLVGYHGLRTMRDKPAEEIEIVWKVEGISDLLALQAAIPRELRAKHLVITNAAGATETSLPAEVATVFSGHRLVIIHDCDEPGQNGAKLWMGAAAKLCRSAVNLVLPYAITEKHGKDLRDWLTTPGNDYAGLVKLAEAAEQARREQRDIDFSPATIEQSGPTGHPGPTDTANPPRPPAAGGNDPNTSADTLTVHQSILKRMGAIVLGHVSGGSKIFAFAEKTGKTFEIGDIGRYKLENLLFDLGEHVEPLINTSPEPDPTKITLSQAKRAFAIEGGKRVLSDAGYLGAGVWEVNGRLMLVNAGSAAIWNCKFSETRIPSCEGKLLDFGAATPWFDFDDLSEMLHESESPEWCMGVLNEAEELFRRWDNWVHDDTPQLITALICCTWLQTIWTWRPQVAVAGPTSSGKSMFLETTLRHLFGPLAIFCAKATAAGIRQQVRNTARVMIIDEFEHDNHRQEILELFRASSRGAEIIRGTSDQKGTKFGLRHIPWVGAIETGMRKAADRNRYIILELKKVAAGKASKLRIPTPAVLQALGLKLLVLGLRHWKTAVRLAEGLQAYPVDGVDHRAIETYAVPSAMLGAIMGLDEAAAAALMKNMLSRRDFSQQQESDEEQVLKAIFESVVSLKGGERASVSELLAGSISSHNESPTKVLQRVGVRRVELERTPDKGYYQDDEKNHLFFSPAMICRELLRGTEFAGQNIEEVLCRIPGARRSRQKMGGHLPRGVLIPESSITEIISGSLIHVGTKEIETTVDYQDL